MCRLAPLALFALATGATAQTLPWERVTGPYGGWVTTIATVPGAALAANADGLHRSTDAGGSWSPAPTGFPDLLLLSLVAGPSGEAYAVARNGPVLRSTDAGVTWEPFDEGLPTGTERPPLAVGPAGELYYGSSTGLYRRGPGDEAWAPTALAGEVLAVAVGPDGTVLASTREPVGWDYFVVRRSTDGGQTWTANILRYDAYATVRALAFLPDGTALAGGVEEPKGYVDPGLYRSTDGGETWAVVPDQEEVSVYEMHAAPTEDGGAVAFATYLGYSGGLRSTDGGRTWATIPFRVYGAAPAGDGSVLAATDYLGVQRTVDGGATWADATTGIGRADMGRVAIGPDGTIYGACAPDYGPCEGLQRSTDGGQTWARFAVGSPGGFLAPGARALVVDEEGRLFVAPERCGAGLRATLHRSTDRGETWEDVTPPGLEWQEVSFRALATDTTGALYACSYLAFYRTTDGGATWDRRDASGCDIYDDVASSPDGVLYRGSVNGLLRSTDGALTWEHVEGVPGPVEAVSGGPDGSVYAAVHQQGVYASADGGATWVRGDLALVEQWSRVEDLAVAGGGLAFAGTDDPAVVFRTTDGGATWERADDGLPTSSVYFNDLAFDASGRLLAGLSQWGLYRTVAPIPTEEPARPMATALSPPRPNPAGDAVMLTLTLARPEHVAVAAYDVLGRRVAILHEGPLAAGAHRLAFDTSALRLGTYVVRALAGGSPFATTVTVAR